MFQNEFNYYVHVFVSRYMERDDLMKFIKKNFSISFLKNLFSRYTNTNASRTHISTGISRTIYLYAFVFMHDICKYVLLLQSFLLIVHCDVLHELQITVTTLGLSVLISSMTFAVIKITENKYYSI